MKIFISLIALAILNISAVYAQVGKKRNFSGIYPHLAYYNNEGECGTGAVVPWANKLWVITYGPHLPFGSSDKLYEISADLNLAVRPESIGGTPASRLIHKESDQLFIGPYAIDRSGNVRTLSYKNVPGRYTGAARHLTDPANKIYIGTMEEGFYEIDVNTLSSSTLYHDANVKKSDHHDVGVNPHGGLLPGAHGKGLYSGQGVMVFSNNGEATKEALEKFDVEAGVLAEWDGTKWTTIRRSQFVEVTGPGGIYGNMNPADPIWATGWDHRSVLLGVRDNGGWNFFRLPKASHSYDGAHGWNTEWPRIRDVGTESKPDYLMTMHGLFWRFPKSFSSANSAGIRPRSSYLKVIGDFTRWKEQLVFGCDDSAQKEFLNKRKIKGNIEGPGQSNSNLWFTSLTLPDELGPATAEGAVWLNDDVNANIPSEPFLFAGWKDRMAWVHNTGSAAAVFTFEVDLKGDGKWSVAKKINVNPGQAVAINFADTQQGEWIRASSNVATKATVHFAYNDLTRFKKEDRSLFAGIARAGDGTYTGGLLYGLGDNRRALGILSGTIAQGKFSPAGYYELDADMNLVEKEDATTSGFIGEKFAIPSGVVEVEESSVLVIDDKGRRWRFPLGDDDLTEQTKKALSRICREVATERDLLNLHGTFYELPAENADGFAKVRPVASHDFAIHDYASYRGMLVLTGLQKEAKGAHIVSSKDGKASVWAGTIDDLWSLGKPRGTGGPWKNSSVKAGEPSDPYLIGFYDKRKLTLSHHSKDTIAFAIEVEPVGHGQWMKYREVRLGPGQKFEMVFEKSFQSRWIRFSANRDCEATAWLVYE